MRPNRLSAKFILVACIWAAVVEKIQAGIDRQLAVGAPLYGEITILDGDSVRCAMLNSIPPLPPAPPMNSFCAPVKFILVVFCQLYVRDVGIPSYLQIQPSQARAGPHL